MVLLERRLDKLDQPIAPLAARCPVGIGLLLPAQIDSYLHFRPDTDPAEIHQRLARGQYCFVAWLDGQIIHAGWAATDQAYIEYLDRGLDLAPDEVYAYESFTLSAYRAQGLAQARQSYMLEYLRRVGYQRVIAAVMPENKTAFLPLEKVGYHSYAVRGSVQLGRWRSDFSRRLQTTAVSDPPLGGAAYWEQIAQQIETAGHYLDPFLGKLKRDEHLALVQRWCGIPVSGRVLKTDLFEEALGPDALLPDLVGSDGMTGVDIAPAIVRRAQRREHTRAIDYLAADVRHLPFADNTFALILSPSTLDHFVDPHDLRLSLRELARVLAPDGQLTITVDNRQNLFDPILRLAARLRRLPYFLGTSYTVNELREELEAVGFQVQESTALLHNPRGMAVAAVALARWLSWLPLFPLVQRLLIAAQGLEQTRWRYWTGSFIAAKATLPEVLQDAEAFPPQIHTRN
jgi:SAM-dependent methyltransferase/GNAT superfamily N-acetyltransferase